MKVTGQIYDLAALRLTRDAGTQRTEGWVGPIASTDALGKKKSIATTGIRTADRPARGLITINIFGTALFWVNTRSGCNSFQTFRDYLFPFFGCLTPTDGTDRLSQNVGKKLPLLAA